MTDDSGEDIAWARKQPDPRQSAQDWITIWQSELQALAVDREARETWLRWIATWAEAARAGADFLPAAHDSGSSRAALSPGSKAAMAASDPGGDALRRLAERVAALERELTERANPAEPEGD
jgi:hypothetical protein